MRNAVLLSLVLAACGDNGSSTTCGTGTTLMGGMCVADPATECGPGTMLVDGQCVLSTQPPTCGPGTKLDTASNACVVDTSSPDPVTGLTATAAGGNVSLSWTAGANSNGTLVVRTVAGAYDAPVPGMMYMVGMTLPGGSKVVSVGSGTTATDAAATPGRYSYVAWSQNASGNYGFGREVSTVATIPTQSAVLTLDVANNTATVTTQAGLIPLTLANLAFDGTGGTLSVDIGATNNTAGHLFNLKAVVKAVSTGTVTSVTGTLANNDKFLALGRAANLPGVADVLGNTLTMSGITSTDVVTINVDLIESGLGLAGGNLIDVLGGDAGSADLPETRGNRHGSLYSDGFASASGRYFYVTTRWHPTLFRIDTSSGSVTSVSPFANGNATCIRLGADGFAYAAYQLGPHRSVDGYGLGIAKIDPISLTVVAKNEVSGVNAAIGRGCAVHGTTFAASYGPLVFLANTATMAFVDTDATTATVPDPIDSGATDTIRSLLFGSDGTLYAAATKSDKNIYAINTTTFAVSTYHTVTTDVAKSLTLDSAGTMWWVSASGLTSFDGTTETTVPQGTPLPMSELLGFAGTKAIVISNDTNSAFTFDPATGDVTGTGVIDSEKIGHRAILFLTP